MVKIQSRGKGILIHGGVLFTHIVDKIDGNNYDA